MAKATVPQQNNDDSEAFKNQTSQVDALSAALKGYNRELSISRSIINSEIIQSKKNLALNLEQVEAEKKQNKEQAKNLQSEIKRLKAQEQTAQTQSIIASKEAEVAVCKQQEKVADEKISKLKISQSNLNKNLLKFEREAATSQERQSIYSDKISSSRATIASIDRDIAIQQANMAMASEEEKQNIEAEIQALKDKKREQKELIQEYKDGLQQARLDESAEIASSASSPTEEASIRAEKINQGNQAYNDTMADLKKQLAMGSISDQEYNDKAKEAEDDRNNLFAAFANMGSGEGLGGLLGGLMGGSGGGLGSIMSGAMSEGIGSVLGSGSPMIAAINAGLDLLSSIRGKMDEFVDDAASVFAQYMAQVDSRLYGDLNGKSFTEIMNSLDNTIGASPYINQKSFIENVAKMAQLGIDYNLEQRALWATLSEKMVSTFDAMDEKLGRMILLQQSDVTMAQMGIEAAINRLLNGIFKDNSYLNNVYDSVYRAIFDASSIQTDTDQSTQFNYTVQKWLGGLYSVGASSETVTKIASAINTLATGDISSLSDSTNTLMQLAAVKGGLSYADLLTNGLTAEDTNKLLKSMIEYLQDIATNTSDNVMKSQWGDILGMEMSDWKAITNLTESDLSNLYNSTMNQQQAQEEVTYILNNLVAERTHISDAISTAISNAMFNFGVNVANDSATYLTWKASGLIDSFIDSMNIEGFGKTILGALSSLLSLGGMVKGVAGMVTSIMSGIKTGGVGNYMDSNVFSFTMDRGTGEYSNMTTVLDQNGGVTTGTSSSGTMTITLPNVSNVTVEEADDFTVDSSDDEDDYDYDTVDTEDVSTSASDREFTTLQGMEEDTSATVESVYNDEGGLVRDVSDLYAELFESQTRPIKVNLVTEDGAQSLGQFFIDKVTSMDSRLQGTLNVSVSGDLGAQLASMRG